MSQFTNTAKVFAKMLIVVLSIAVLFAFAGWYALVFIGLVVMWVVASVIAEKRGKPSR
jgi:uncharacterized membrane protein YqjE